MYTPPHLLKNTFNPLPSGSIHPTGWLLNQLCIQADGLSGHIDEFWPDIANSAWIGGSGEGWERAPYWLDGLVPLAFLLDDEHLKGKVQHWIAYILDHQHEDGWLGPIHDKNYGYQYDPWPVYIVLKALTQYYEATTDPRVIPAMERFLRRLQTQLEQTPLTSWAQLRGADLVLSIYWLYRRTHEERLLALAQTIQQQTFDWQAQFVDFPYKEKQTEWQFQSHVVNNAMALKQPALWYQLTHDEADRQAVEHMIETLDIYHGQATGVFSGDEVLAGKNPSQGTELCAVVEYMFSLETLLAISGVAAFADRLERIAFNAQWRQIGGAVPHADWEVHPLEPWNYALEIDREHPERSCSAASRPVGNMPFSPEGAPIQLHVYGRRVPGWTIEHNAAGPLPQSPVNSTEPREKLTLIPYGCTDLRVTEFPTLE